MIVETSPKISWKDKLLGITSGSLDAERIDPFGGESAEELKFLEGDIHRSVVNGTPAIDFSERIQQILFKEMDSTVIIKLLGRSIGYAALSNRLNSLWNPSKPFHLMDIENGYYLVKLHSIHDYTKVLSQGPWLVYGQYLTVQPWTKEFRPSQPFPSIVMAWIRLPGLSGHLYKKEIIEEMGGLIGKVVRLDLNTDNRTRGHFARMAVYINLNKPLTAQVFINGMKQKVEYESLPAICFNCGKYGHTKDFCPLPQTKSTPEKDQSENTPTEVEKEEKEGTYGHWMMVDRKSRSHVRKNNFPKKDNNERGKSGSRFQALAQSGGQEEMGHEHNQRNKEEEQRQLLSGMNRNNNEMQMEGIKSLSGPSAPQNIPTSNKGAERPQRIYGNKKAFESMALKKSETKTKEGQDNKVVGPAIINKDSLINGKGNSFFNEQVSHSLSTKDITTKPNGQTFIKTVADPPKEIPTQTNNGVDTICANDFLFNTETGSSAQISFNVLNNNLNIESSFLHGNNNTPQMSNISCLNPIFDDQGIREVEGFSTPPKIASTMDNMVEVHMNNIGDPNNNKHTAVSFKERGLSNKMSKSRASGKLMGGKESGCASNKFLRVFREYNLEYKPYIVCLLEPRVSGHKASSIIDKLGFDRSHRIESAGFSEGIWVRWKEYIPISIIHNHPQFMIFRIQGTNLNDGFFLVVVYGSPDRTRRKLLWENLTNALPQASLPWLILGDFNAILSPQDKKSDRSIGKRCKLFGTFVDNCNLQDLGYIGPSYTWQRGNTFERLDRALANDAWISAFPHSRVHHLPRIKSDHRPIFLKTTPMLNAQRGRPFRFIAGWTKHANFKDLVSSKWRYSGNMADSLSEFTSHVKEWNRRLANLEMEVRDELETVLNHEEILWRQKARCDWLQFGDRNTKYFHSHWIQRRKFNHILALRINNGEWCSEQDILRDEAIKIKDQDIDFLNKPVLREEIKKALFDMAPLKATGSDRFHAFFFQSQWDIVGGAVCECVQGIFDGNKFEEELNNTLIILIPKKKSPEDFSQFRPISLCSVLYKLVMKVIVNRLKVVFPKYISPEQAGFIAGRNISDNIIIAQEVIHSMRSKKGGKKWMAIKLDLEKAYDRVSWKFIEMSLIAAVIPEKIRKGCPLSPYLFVLCMEWLGYLIKSEMKTGKWQPIRLSRSGPALSRLFFADDLVIFCKAEMSQALLLKEILKRFCDLSGHKISARKRRVTLAQSVLLAIPSYFMQSNQLPESIHKHQCSHLWKSLSKVWTLLRENLMWSIGDGSTIRGWKDNWIPDVGPLLSCVPAHDKINLDITLKDWVLQDGSWNVDMLRIWLTEDMRIRGDLKKTFGKSSGNTKDLRESEPFFGLWLIRGSLPTQKDTEEELHRAVPVLDAVTILKTLCTSFAIARWPKKLGNLLFLRRSNPDGAVARITGDASAGGVVQDQDGKWISGYTHYLGKCSPLEAELWGILDGVLILKNNGYKRIIINTDNLEVVKALTTEDMTDTGNTLIRRIKRFLHSEGQWNIKHVPRECNLVADQMAKIGLSWQTSLRIFEVPPDIVAEAFLHRTDTNVL
ncbi:reverse transcriptase [Gossypium australe]|uniref:Reverse transcriptase n=1 Tax=Gossypium australe TaxID=47621 RepID=A0A5B6UKI4_9ROSI|nr:reverse transcriptase [Gossypium australe]